MPKRAAKKQPTIRIPNNWSPRPYQLPALEAFERGRRDQFHVWHRRAGKDSFALNLAAIWSQREVGTYWHVYPYRVQAKKAIWNGIGRDGVRFIDQAFPPEIRSSTIGGDEMLIEFANGSTWQLCGADNYNSLVGSNVRGVVFSEWALCDPAAWDYIRPILAENKGWAVFITTYRGKNHAYTMYERLKSNPEWFCSLLTVNDTRDWDGAPIMTPADIERERLEGMDEAMIQQEYFCDPLAAFSGSFYGNEMQKLKLQGRLTSVAYDPKFPVYAIWDLGWVDHLSAIYVQPRGNESDIIGSRSWRMTTIPDAIADERKTFPWEVDTDVLPWDAAKNSLETGSTWQQVFEDQRRRTEIAPKLSVFEGIEQTRLFLPTCRIDIDKRPWAPDGNNLLLIESLTGYRTELQKGKPGVFQRSPAHTWESHLADAARYFAVFRASGGLTLGEWGPAPDWSRHDKAVI